MTFTELNEIKKSYKVLELAVDFINPSYNISRAKHLDNARYILCTLTENGIPRNVKTDEVARIRLQKPDRTHVYNDCDILEDGRVLITLTEQILAVEGNALCDIQLVNEQTGIIYSTKNFIINIDKTAVNNSVIASSDEFDALNKLIATNKKINEELKANEKIRQENETERINNENERKENETNRQNEEAERVNAENIRKANENVRIVNENTRKANENIRNENENTRKTNEEIRKTNEDARKINENNRQDTEKQRINEENTRKTNENIRKENETGRVNAENQRINAENQRVNEENTRTSNENTRILNENTRKSNETTRQNQESDRQANTALAVSNAEKATKKANDAADDLQNKLDTHHFVLTEDKDVAGGVPSLDNNKKVPVAELYEATTASKGITQLTDSVTSTSTSTSATPNSVKTAYDKAVSAGNDLKAHNSSSTAHEDIRTLISELHTRLITIADSDDVTLDQFSEIVAYIKKNKSLIDGITTNKVNVADIIDSLTSTATNKPLSAKQGKVLNDLITALTAVVGNKVDKVSGKGLSTNDYTTTEKNKLSGIASGAEVNQNAFSNIVAGSVTISADSKTDTFTIVAGSNITLTADAANDKLTITAKDTTYSLGTASVLGLTKLYTGTGTATDGTMTQAAIKTALDGKANASHGNHVPAVQTANNAVFLRNDNTWQTITPANIGAAAANHSHNYAAPSHTHGLLHSDLGVIVANTTTDNGWSMINGAYNGYILKSIRFQQNAPAWAYGNFASGIAFGGGDTHGVISMPYNTPGLRVAGGNGAKPVWYFSITGGNGVSYNLADFPTKTGSGASGTWGISVTGNSASAAKLQTARKINGVAFDGSKDITISAAPTANSLNYVRVYNSSHIGNNNSVTVNDLAKQHAAVAMIESPTDNPTGARNWIAVWNYSWGDGSNANWVSQLALGVKTNTGMWYRSRQTSIVGAAWTRVLDDSNYTSYTVTKTGGGASGNWGINITGSAGSVAWSNITGKPNSFTPASHTHNYAGSNAAGGGATKMYLPRVAKSAAYQPGVNTMIVEEFTAGTNYSLPTNHWYHIFTGQGSDANYNTQLALGMTIHAVYYRNRNNNSWGSWKQLAFTDSTVLAATKATQDSAGQQINTTYIKGLSVNGRTITYTKGDGTTGTITTQDTNTWRGITDSLTSSDSAVSLSAKAGKSLKDSIDTINGNLKMKTKSYSFSLTVEANSFQSQKIVSDYRISGYTLIGAIVNCTSFSVLNLSVSFQCFDSVEAFVMGINNNPHSYSITGSVNLYYVKNTIIE